MASLTASNGGGTWFRLFCPQCGRGQWVRPGQVAKCQGGVPPRHPLIEMKPKERESA
jgi:hypothetical protein